MHQITGHHRRHHSKNEPDHAAVDLFGSSETFAKRKMFAPSYEDADI